MTPAGHQEVTKPWVVNLEEVVNLALPLATAPEARQLGGLAERLNRRRLRVLVAGEAKRGKSTLVNALLGRALLPTGVTPLTAVTTTVTTAPVDQPEHAVVTLLSGATRPVALDELATVVTETGNPGNAAGADVVTVYVHNRLLARHPVDLVDTPGTGSVYAHNTTNAHRAMASLDAAVLVLTVDPPVTDAERDLLREIDRLSVRTFILLNKSDRLSVEEVAEAEAFTREVCSAATGHPASVRVCSARAGIADPGFAAFMAELSDYLDERGERDVDAALAGHLSRTLSGMVDARLVRARMLELAATGQQRRLDELATRLAVIADRRSDIEDRCVGALRRLRRALDRGAASSVAPTVGACRQSLANTWDSELADLDPAAAEERGREAVTSSITAAVDHWRAEQTEALEAGLARVIERAEQDVAIQAQLAREAVNELLDLSIHAGPQLPRLEVDPSFHYDFSPADGWAPPLHGLVSRLGTRSHRRTRARRRLAEEVASLTDRQLGRARSDLQRRLEQTGRAIQRALDEQLAQAIDVFRNLVDEAAAEMPREPDGARALPAGLREEAAELQRLLAALVEDPPG